MNKIVVAILVSICATLFIGCKKDVEYQHFEGAVWHTSFHISYQSNKNLNDSIARVMKLVEQSLSPFCDSSGVTMINNNVTDVTDTLFRKVFAMSQKVNGASGGVYDPTVAPLVDLWGFGRNKEVPEPTAAQIDSALCRVGIAKCRLVGARLVKPIPDMIFNFSSITKGYGCDLVGEMLRRNGCDNFLVEIGGEMCLCGVNPKGEKWHVMIEAPIVSNSGSEKLLTLPLTNCAVATSGNYRNYRDTHSGVRVGHTISPVTGRPIVSSTLSATVIARDCMTADALATACMAMPASQALQMIGTWPGAEVLLVVSSKTGNSPWTILRSENFPN